MPLSAHLRVYVPVNRSDGPVLEHVEPGGHAGSVLRAGIYGVTAESSRDDAFVIDDGGIRFVCPRNPRLRMLEGVLAFHNTYSDSPLERLVPESIADRAADELDRLKSRHPGVRSHILTSPFTVPLRWFAAFSQGERRIDEIDGRMRITYRTGLAEAMHRLRRAVQILEEAGLDETIVEQVQDVLGWLDGFPPDALVELDYGSVVDLFDDTDLVLDESAAEIGASLEALERGDYEEAGEQYAAAASRWAHAHALTYAN